MDESQISIALLFHQSPVLPSKGDKEAEPRNKFAESRILGNPVPPTPVQAKLKGNSDDPLPVPSPDRSSSPFHPGHFAENVHDRLSIFQFF